MPSPPRRTGLSGLLHSKLFGLRSIVAACDKWHPPRVGIGVTCLELCAEDKPIWT